MTNTPPIVTCNPNVATPDYPMTPANRGPKTARREREAAENSRPIHQTRVRIKAHITPGSVGGIVEALYGNTFTIKNGGRSGLMLTTGLVNAFTASRVFGVIDRSSL